MLLLNIDIENLHLHEMTIYLIMIDDILID